MACCYVFDRIVVFFVPVTAKASGLVEFNQNSQYLYSTYDLENYDLDFYVDSSWSWIAVELDGCDWASGNVWFVLFD